MDELSFAERDGIGHQSTKYKGTVGFETKCKSLRKCWLKSTQHKLAELDIIEKGLQTSMHVKLERKEKNSNGGADKIKVANYRGF